MNGREGTGRNLLGRYRVLDLSDEKHLLCGKFLAALGADVIKVERPGGDPFRLRGPFDHDERDSKQSLPWFAYNVGKRGVTLNIENRHGQEIFMNLLKRADFLLESFSAGYMENLGLGYSVSLYQAGVLM